MLKTMALAAAMSSFNNVTVVKTVDGDTVRVTLGKNLPLIFRDMRVRLKGIQAPETSAERECERANAQLAKAELTRFIGNEKVNLLVCEPDKFYRIACHLGIGSAMASDHMLAAGLSQLYDGGTKRPWDCLK